MSDKTGKYLYECLATGSILESWKSHKFESLDAFEPLVADVVHGNKGKYKAGKWTCQLKLKWEIKTQPKPGRELNRLVSHIQFTCFDTEYLKNWNPRCTTATSITPDPAVGIRGHTGRDRPSGIHDVLGNKRTDTPREGWEGRNWLGQGLR
jgi:hypothetical protein